MLISRNYLLMILDDERGKRYSRASAAKDLGLAGAMLMDLFLRGKISIERKRVKIIDPSTTGDEYLDEILGILLHSKRERKLRIWVDKLSRRYKTYYYLFFMRLEDQGIVRREVKKALKIFEITRFYLQRPEVKATILEQIQNVIVNNLSPGIELLCLLSLLKVSNLIKVYIAKEYRKEVKRRIDEMIQSEILDPRNQEMIMSITKAIKDIMNARQAAAAIAATAAAS